MKRIILAIKLFWFGLKNPDLLSETVFINMAKMLEMALMVANKDKPYTCHLMLADKRLVSFWMYPGINKNPVDRITELIGEVEALKELSERVAVQRTTTVCQNEIKN